MGRDAGSSSISRRRRRPAKDVSARQHGNAAQGRAAGCCRAGLGLRCGRGPWPWQRGQQEQQQQQRRALCIPWGRAAVMRGSALFSPLLPWVYRGALAATCCNLFRLPVACLCRQRGAWRRRPRGCWGLRGARQAPQIPFCLLTCTVMRCYSFGVPLVRGRAPCWPAWAPPALLPFPLVCQANLRTREGGEGAAAVGAQGRPSRVYDGCIPATSPTAAF